MYRDNRGASSTNVKRITGLRFLNTLLENQGLLPHADKMSELRVNHADFSVDRPLWC
jgi:hypothetical protein